MPAPPEKKPSPRVRTSFQIGGKFELRSWPSSHHPPHLGGPVAQSVRFAHAFSDGGTALETDDGQLIDADTGTLLLEAKPGRLYCAAGRYPNVACLRQASIVNDKGETVATELWLHQAGLGATVVSRVGPEGSISPLGIHVDQGPASYLFSVYPGGKDAVTTTHWVSAGLSTPVLFDVSSDWLRALGSGRPNVPVRFVTFNGQPYAIYRVDNQLFAKTGAEIASNAPGRLISDTVESVYEFRAVAGTDGWLYVFFHDPASKSVHLATSSDGYQFSVGVLDKRETGTQLEAFTDADGVYAAYYYHINQFDRGVRLVTLWNGALEHRPCTLVREEKHNVGWGIGFSPSRNGGVWLTYFDPVEEGERQRVWSRQQMSALREKHCEGVTLGDMNDLNLNLGVGIWYDNWRLHGNSLAAKDNEGIGVGGSEYDVDPALLTTVAFEARYKQIDIALQYGKELLKEDLNRVEKYSRLAGSFKIEKLLPGHDIRLEAAYGHHSGSMTPGDGVRGKPRSFETRYADIHLYAVNTWRIKYGLAFTRYELPVPVHVYTSGQGQTQYHYEGSFTRDAASTLRR
jgi:hypothetical protein